MTPFIETHLGERFMPLAPALSSIWVEDIAHALSHQCRFSGHCSKFYSVAEHCVRVSWLLQEWGEDEDVQMWGLLHDASEAYLVDLPTPLKQSEFGAEYRRAEGELMARICERFHLAPPEPHIVRVADAILLRTEARDLMPFKPEHWKGLDVEPLVERVDPWSSEVAKTRFLTRFQYLDVRR